MKDKILDWLGFDSLLHMYAVLGTVPTVIIITYLVYYALQ